jgi:hypothetical protein
VHEGIPAKHTGKGKVTASATAAAKAEADLKWKKQSEDLRSAMKASREITRRCV